MTAEKPILLNHLYIKYKNFIETFLTMIPEVGNASGTLRQVQMNKSLKLWFQAQP